jgi:type IV pilus assembly protein PilW
MSLLLTTTPREGGFTLLETLLAMAIFSVMMIAALTMLSVNQDTYVRGQDAAEVQQNARVALEIASREIRVAGYDLSGQLEKLTQPTPIQSAGSSSLTFVADVDRDGTLDRVGYQLQGDQLVRSFSSWAGSDFGSVVTSELASGIAALGFTYHDATQPTNIVLSTPVTTTDLGKIRRVTVSLITVAATKGASTSYPLLIDIQLRN